MEIEILNINKIKPDPNQPRKEWDEKKLREFGNSYKSIGMIVPIEIDEDNMIVTGESRWRAAKLVDVKTIKCIRLKNLTPKERLTRQLAENVARKSLTIFEQREAIKKLISTYNFKGGRGKKGGESEVARMIGCSQSWISQVLQLDKAIPLIKKAVFEDKIMAPKVGTEIMRLPDQKSQEKYARHYLKLKKEGLRKDSNKVSEEISNIRNGNEIFKDAEPIELERTAHNVTSELYTWFSVGTHKINELIKERNMNELSKGDLDRLLTSTGVLIFVTFKKLVRELIKEGAKPDKKIMELMKLNEI